MTERELSSYFMGLTLRPSRHSDALGMAVVHESTGIVLCVTKDRLSATKARHAFLKAAKWEERSQFSRVELTNMARVAGGLAQAREYRLRVRSLPTRPYSTLRRRVGSVAGGVDTRTPPEYRRSTFATQTLESSRLARGTRCNRDGHERHANN